MYLGAACIAKKIYLPFWAMEEAQLATGDRDWYRGLWDNWYTWCIIGVQLVQGIVRQIRTPHSIPGICPWQGWKKMKAVSLIALGKHLQSVFCLRGVRVAHHISGGCLCRVQLWDADCGSERVESHPVGGPCCGRGASRISAQGLTLSTQAVMWQHVVRSNACPRCQLSLVCRASLEMLQNACFWTSAKHAYSLGAVAVGARGFVTLWSNARDSVVECQWLCGWMPETLWLNARGSVVECQRLCG